MYNTPIFIPSIKKNWYFKPVSTSLQKDICKAILIEDEYYTFIRTTNKVIKKCAHIKYKEEIKALTLIDKLAIYLQLRCISVGDTTEFELDKNSKKYNVTYNFSEILLSLLDITNKFVPLLIQFGDLEISCNIPNFHLEYELAVVTNKDIKYEDLVRFFINYIKTSDKKIYFYELTINDQNAFVDALPVNVQQQIIQFIHYVIEYFNALKIYFFFEEKDASFICIGKPFIEYMKLILDTNLYSIYQEIYILSKHANMPPSYIDTITAAERTMYISLIQQENSRPEEESSDIGDDNTPLPPGMYDPLANLDTYQQAMGG